MPFLPTAAEVAALGLDPASRPGDFDCRKVLTPPGVVYTVVSGTGMTGRMFSRECISYDDAGAEFVFRQPRCVEELLAIGRAQDVELLGCYRFDGLQRWTLDSARAWWQHVDVVQGYLETMVRRGGHREVRQGARAHLDYLASQEHEQYRRDLLEHLAQGPAPIT